MSKHQWSNIVFGLLSIIFGFFYVYYDWSVGIWLILFACWFSLIIYGLFNIRSNFHLTSQSNFKTNGQVVALTFDDGPTEFTPAVLDLLKQYGAKATFFCVGKQIESFPEIFKCILEDGHQIGNHTYTHDKNMGFKSTKELVDEIQKTNDLIYQFSGRRTNLFRPPFGVTNPNFRRAVQKTNMKVMGWSIRSLDTVLRDDNKILGRILSKLEPGAIVLLHDSSQRTVDVLARLLATMEDNNIRSIQLDNA
jgi:peptidoglycan/xylan/chitin deacetylase (PgdA/CDA1 family)